MNEKLSLYEIKNMFQELLIMLEDSDECTKEVILGSLECLECTAEEKLEGCGYVLKQYDANIDMCKQEINRLQKKVESLERGKQRLKDSVLSLMNLMDTKKVKTLTYTFSVKPGSIRLIIDNEREIPEQFLIPQPDRVDKTKLKDFIKAKGSTTYAHNEIGDDVLQVRG